MKRVLPYPLMWLALFVMWLLVNDSLAPGHILMGAALAFFGCWALTALEPPQPRIGRAGSIARLFATFIGDVVMSNIAVIGLILSGRPPRSTFVTIPLDLKEPNGLAVLACIVTATPGSAWIHYDSNAGTVIIHVLDTPDGAAWGVALKRNYEERLVEIFR